MIPAFISPVSTNHPFALVSSSTTSSAFLCRTFLPPSQPPAITHSSHPPHMNAEPTPLGAHLHPHLHPQPQHQHQHHSKLVVERLVGSPSPFPPSCSSIDAAASAPTPAPLFDPADPSAMCVDPSSFVTDPAENLKAFLKTRASLDVDETVVFWWTGEIYAVVPEQPAKHLFSFEGFNIARLVPVQGQAGVRGYRMLTREGGFYKKPGTNEILEWYKNEVTGNIDRVVHVWNDPVNQQFMLQGPRGPFKVPVTVAQKDVTFNAEIFLKYDNPLPKSEFPNISASNLYEGAELFQFFTSLDDLETSAPSVSCNISWVRLSQYLPFMQMGDRDGRLLYHCRGKKLSDGFAGLPLHIQDYVRTHNPQFQYAPETFVTPNETSWTYYRKLIHNKWQPRADGTIAKPDLAPLPTPQLGSSVTRTFTKRQLAAYNGTNPNAQILLSVQGHVFDVTKGRKHYGHAETYNCLTGKDSTRAFITGDLKQFNNATKFLDLKQLSPEQINTANEWLAFFQKHYTQLGICLGWDENEDNNDDHPQQPLPTHVTSNSLDSHHVDTKQIFEKTFEILSLA